MKKKIVIPEALNKEALDHFRNTKKFELKTLENPNRDLLKKELLDANALIVRSKTKVDKELIAAGKILEVIGRAGVGTDNIDIDFAESQGILVINAPEESLDSVADLTIGLILGICRHINVAISRTCKGDFNRKGLMGFELQGKTLGILGYGRIGRKVSSRAKPFGLKIIAHDPYISGTAESGSGVNFVSFETLLKTSDIISIHVPLNERTSHMISKNQFALMKEGVFLINTSRGEVVDNDALFEALQSGRIAGAGLDVVEEESESCVLIDHPNVLITPHIGASTVDAQKNVSWRILEGIFEVLEGHPPMYPVNFPKLSDEIKQIYIPFRDLVVILAQLLVRLNQERFNTIQFSYPVSLPPNLMRTLSRYFLAIFLKPLVSTRINIINSVKIAEGRQIQIIESIRTWKEIENVINIQIRNDSEINVQASGMVDSSSVPHIIQINGYSLEFSPSGNIFLIVHDDIPGMIGKVCTFIGDQNINIAELQVARNLAIKTQMMMLKMDEGVADDIINKMKKLTNIRSVSYYELK